MKTLLIVITLLAGIVSCDQIRTAAAVKTCEAKKAAGQLAAPFDNCDILKY
ncbi:hypothetical protein [Vibrio phage R01]|nr:hypothetical protein [Vibrio phage R01]